MNQFDPKDTATLVKALRQYVQENCYSSHPRTVLFALAADRLEELENATSKGDELR